MSDEHKRLWFQAYTTTLAHYVGVYGTEAAIDRARLVAEAVPHGRCAWPFSSSGEYPKSTAVGNGWSTHARP